MKTSELFLMLVIIFEMCTTIGFPVYILITSDDNCTTIFKELKEWISEIFYHKNLFGKILSCLVIIVFMPGIIMALGFNILLYVIMLFRWIWNLGNKK